MSILCGPDLGRGGRTLIKTELLASDHRALSLDSSDSSLKRRAAHFLLLLSFFFFFNCLLDYTTTPLMTCCSFTHTHTHILHSAVAATQEEAEEPMRTTHASVLHPALLISPSLDLPLSCIPERERCRMWRDSEGQFCQNHACYFPSVRLSHMSDLAGGIESKKKHDCSTGDA